MADLSYSSEAENVLSKFYRVDTVVYVEGVDDVLFWEYLFALFSEHSFKIKEVGGKLEVQKYVEKIRSGEINAIVARDADFSYTEKFPDNPNILRSYGYSIENSMICMKSLKKVIRSMGKMPVRAINETGITDWFDKLFESTKDLVLFDIANDLLKAGKVVSGDNCSRFMKSRKSPDICDNKIAAHLSKLDFELSKSMEEQITNALDISNRNISDCIRGHFLFSASLKYVASAISKLRKGISISNDSYFGAIHIAFENIFNDDHNHYEYYRDIVKKVEIMA